MGVMDFGDMKVNPLLPKALTIRFGTLAAYKWRERVAYSVKDGEQVPQVGDTVELSDGSHVVVERIERNAAGVATFIVRPVPRS